MARSLKVQSVRCLCGEVELAAAGAPTTTVVCYCDDCQAAARQLEALPGAPPLLDRAGGTEFVVYRKDRVTVARGADRLRRTKLKEGSPTNRAVAACWLLLERHALLAQRARFGEKQCAQALQAFQFVVVAGSEALAVGPFVVAGDVDERMGG